MKTMLLLRPMLVGGAVAAASVVLAGCASESSETGYDRTERALRDPMGYKPNMTDTGVSGGKDMELDKGGLKRDLDHVLMP
jgi:hypothetical protein